MSALKASSAEVYLTSQAVAGAIDSNPVFDKVRRTDGRVSQQNSFEKSSEIKSSLQGQKNALTNVELSNSFSVEVTQNFMLFARSVLMNNAEPSVSVTASTISFDSGANTIADSGNGFGDVVDGQWVFVSGAGNNALDKAYYVVTATSGLLTCSDVQADESAGASITVNGTSIRSGNTEHLLTIQGRDDHTGATNDTDYKTQYDGVIDAMSFSIPDSGLLTGSATIIAATQEPGLEPIAGQTDNPVDNSDVLGSAMDFNGFYPDQIDVENNFTDATIDIARNTATQNAAGKLGALCVAQDVIGITGTLTSIRKKADPAAEESKYDNSTRFSMSFGFEWPDGKMLMITMRQMVYTDGSIASGSGDFANFAGTYDAEEDSFGTTIQFDTNIGL